MPSDESYDEEFMFNASEYEAILEVNSVVHSQKQRLDPPFTCDASSVSGSSFGDSLHVMSQSFSCDSSEEGETKDTEEATYDAGNSLVAVGDKRRERLTVTRSNSAAFKSQNSQSQSQPSLSSKETEDRAVREMLDSLQQQQQQYDHLEEQMNVQRLLRSQSSRRNNRHRSYIQQNYLPQHSQTRMPPRFSSFQKRAPTPFSTFHLDQQHQQQRQQQQDQQRTPPRYSSFRFQNQHDEAIRAPPTTNRNQKIGNRSWSETFWALFELSDSCFCAVTNDASDHHHHRLDPHGHDDDDYDDDAPRCCVLHDSPKETRGHSARFASFSTRRHSPAYQ